MNYDLESRLLRAESWISRAQSERHATDSDGQFVFYWIALNALYGQAKYLEEARDKDWQDLHNFLAAICRIDRDRVILTCLKTFSERDPRRLLENQFLYREYWEQGLTDELQDRIDRAAQVESGPTSKYVIEVFDRIRLLRNQIFHGCAKDGSGANRESVEAAVAVLEKMVPAIVRVMRNFGGPEDWGPLSFPAKGRPGHPEDRRTR